MPYSDPDKQRAFARAWAARHKSDNPELLANRRRYRQRAAYKHIKEIKESKPCTDCGIRYPHFIMQFDHISGDKEWNVAAMANGGYSITSIDAEIAKCELVCANCHSTRTFKRKMGMSD